MGGGTSKSESEQWQAMAEEASAIGDFAASVSALSFTLAGLSAAGVLSSPATIPLVYAGSFFGGAAIGFYGIAAYDTYKSDLLGIHGR
ncbi:MAG: hypothetical protein IPM96_16165 [Ignavibacteria bacterium]|nr:hypothetical protein [Ignavibacteria bacterium]